jgi:hypothetical protein
LPMLAQTGRRRQADPGASSAAGLSGSLQRSKRIHGP